MIRHIGVDSSWANALVAQSCARETVTTFCGACWFHIRSWVGIGEGSTASGCSRPITAIRGPPCPTSLCEVKPSFARSDHQDYRWASRNRAEDSRSET